MTALAHDFAGATKWGSAQLFGVAALRSIPSCAVLAFILQAPYMAFIALLMSWGKGL